MSLIVIPLLFVLGGCFSGSQDLSALGLPQVFPLNSGTYVPDNPEFASFKIRKKSDGYDVEDLKSKERPISSYKVFRIAEREGFFILQEYNPARSSDPYAYSYAQISDDGEGSIGFKVYAVGEEGFKKMPPALAQLMTVDGKFGLHGWIRENSNVHYVLREVARRRIPLKLMATYTLKR